MRRRTSDWETGLAQDLQGPVFAKVFRLAAIDGRCRMHGGLSTGPRTAEGIERIRQSRTKYGIYSQRFKAQQAHGREVMRQLKALVDALERSPDS